MENWLFSTLMEEEPEWNDTGGLYDSDDLSHEVSKLLKNIDPGLSEQPCTLDTALLQDKGEALLKRLQHGQWEERFLTDSTLILQGDILAEAGKNIDWKRVTSTEDFHQWAALQCFQGNTESKYLEEALQAAEPAKDDAKATLGAFWAKCTSTK